MKKEEFINIFGLLSKCHKQNEKKQKTACPYSWVHNEETNELVLYFPKADKYKVLRHIDLVTLQREI